MQCVAASLQVCSTAPLWQCVSYCDSAVHFDAPWLWKENANEQQKRREEGCKMGRLFLADLFVFVCLPLSPLPSLLYLFVCVLRFVYQPSSQISTYFLLHNRPSRPFICEYEYVRRGRGTEWSLSVKRKILNSLGSRERRELLSNFHLDG